MRRPRVVTAFQPRSLLKDGSITEIQNDVSKANSSQPVKIHLHPPTVTHERAAIPAPTGRTAPIAA
jgi:hypothetical protein